VGAGVLPQFSGRELFESFCWSVADTAGTSRPSERHRELGRQRLQTLRKQGRADRASRRTGECAMTLTQRRFQSRCFPREALTLGALSLLTTKPLPGRNEDEKEQHK